MLFVMVALIVPTLSSSLTVSSPQPLAPGCLLGGWGGLVPPEKKLNWMGRRASR